MKTLPIDFRDEFVATVERSGLTQAQVAAVLSAWSGESVCGSTVRRWLSDRSRPSSRRCPAWPIICLKLSMDEPVKPMALSALDTKDKKLVESFLRYGRVPRGKRNA